MRILSGLSVVVLMLIISIDELPEQPEQPRQPIMSATHETGTFGEWSGAVGAQCPDRPFCRDSSPEWYCDLPGCGCQVECMVERGPPCQLRAAYCFTLSD